MVLVVVREEVVRSVVLEAKVEVLVVLVVLVMLAAVMPEAGGVRGLREEVGARRGLLDGVELVELEGTWDVMTQGGVTAAADFQEGSRWIQGL